MFRVPYKETCLAINIDALGSRIFLCNIKRTLDSDEFRRSFKMVSYFHGKGNHNQRINVGLYLSTAPAYDMAP